MPVRLRFNLRGGGGGALFARPCRVHFHGDNLG